MEWGGVVCVGVGRWGDIYVGEGELGCRIKTHNYGLVWLGLGGVWVEDTQKPKIPNFQTR